MDIFFILGTIIIPAFLLVILTSIYLLWNNLFIMFLASEISFVLILYNFCLFGYLTDNITNHVIVLSLLLVAAVETILGAIIIINFINLRPTEISIDHI